MFNPGINIALQQFSTPWLDWLMVLFTSLGDVTFYMIVIPILYWCVNRRWGHQLGFVLLGSMWLNGFLKEYFALPRPSLAQGVNVMVHESSYGFPSGHTQGAVTLWGFLAVRSRTDRFRFFCMIVIAMIALSRLYLGAHYLADVVGGFIIGTAVLVVFLLGFTRQWGTYLPKWLKLSLYITVPLLLISLDKSPHAFMKLGILMGLLVTDEFALDGMTYEERATWPKQVGKLVIGFVGLVLLYLAVSTWVPPGLPALLCYAMVSVWVTVGAPLVFQKLGLA